ncbi:MAG: hypothetical protein M1827_006848 [Pycnora praestabilis]|nr:MAG: hypothetical protein M1827_006848 [Pycnora praestabilis]
MLAHHPRRQQFGSFEHLQSPHYTDIPSPSTSTIPLYYTNAYSTSTPSPSEYLHKHQRRNYFDLTSTAENTESAEVFGTYNSFGGPSFMSTPSFEHQSPPIRVQQSTPTPHLSTVASPLRNSMLLQGSLPRNDWQSYNGAIADSSPTGLQLQSPSRKGRGHFRAQSGSSVGSAGPPSPYDEHTTYPQIAHSDRSLSPLGFETTYHGLPDADQDSSTNFSKYSPARTHLSTEASFLAPAFQNYNPSIQNPESNLAAQAAMKQALMEHHGSTDDEATAYSYSEFGTKVPKLDRTISNIYEDELFNPGLQASAPAPQASQLQSNSTLLSPYRSVFSERIQAANNSHLHARSQSPITSSPRGRSPFRPESPYAASVHSFGSQNSPQTKLGSASQMREQQKADADAIALRQHQPSPEEITTPNTISPKDALLDYRESEEDSTMPLFPPENSESKARNYGDKYEYLPTTTQESTQADVDDGGDAQSFRSMATSRRQSSSGYSTTSGPTFSGSSFTFAPPSVPGGVQMPQQYPFISQQRRQNSSMRSGSEPTPEFPAHLTSMESSASEAGPDSSGDIKKPSGTMAETGTYTCTYHGCALRFETPSQLQKHKREGHRQTTPQVGGSGMSSAALMRNSQAGPHKCERINPSTGKPCNTIFSRPYDLTRHEDTIHNARKQKVRCHLCTEEKTFSRNDALTRHMRVVHPEVDFPAGKTRRKLHN